MNKIDDGVIYCAAFFLATAHLEKITGQRQEDFNKQFTRQAEQSIEIAYQDAAEQYLDNETEHKPT